jgi:beta-glucosidase
MVVVLISGNPIDLNWEHQNADALLQAWFPGEQGGKAIADVIFGNYNPSGRLPVTYYKSVQQIPAINDYSMKGHTYRYFDGEVLYPFGYGLSYTHFSYSNLRVSPGTGSTSGKVDMQADVTNTGSRAGDEAVQLYISKDKRDDISPIRQLKGFRKLSLKPGETRTVTFTLDPRSFALVDSRGDLRVDAGSYTIFIGGIQPEAKSIANAETTGVISGKVTLSGETNYLAKDRPYPH